MKKLGLGCMRLPLVDRKNRKSFDMEQITRMVDTYIDRGFSYFDTAYMYHDSESEALLKKVLVDRYPRDKFQIATKLPTMMLNNKEDIPRIFNEQLAKIGVDYFDYYLMHCLKTDLYEKLQEFQGIEFALQMKKEGKIKKLGFSFHDTADVLDKILTEHPEFEFVQLQINYLDWNNDIIQSEKCHQVALKHNKDIIVMEPVKGGALANLPTRAQKLFKAYNEDMSIPSWAIRFAASCDNVFMVLSGMSSMDQLLDNINYMDDFVPLTENEKKLCFEAADIINSSASIPCTACRYCVDGCPKGIAIPEYFTLYNRIKKKEEISEDECIKLLENSGKATDCIECRQCEENCPQHLYIVDSLKDASKSISKFFTL